MLNNNHSLLIYYCREGILNGHSSGENDSKHSTPPSSKKEKKSPKPERPPSSPAAATATQYSPSFPTPIKTDGEGLTNGLPSDPESPPESKLVLLKGY